jgi:hypothetical protein
VAIIPKNSAGTGCASLKKCHIWSRNAARLSHFAGIYKNFNALAVINLP